MELHNRATKGIIFDLDGTLADTLPLCLFSFQEALENVTGNRPTDAEVEAFWGYSEEGIVKNLLPDDWNSYMDEFLKVYKKYHHMCNELFDGMRELLDYLKENSVKMALVTGKGPHTAKISLEELNIGHYFEYVETGSPVGSIKPECIKRILDKWQVPPSEIFYVGDSVGDMKDCNEVGVKPVGAAWATTATPELLLEYNPYKVIHSIEEFESFVREQF